MRAIPAAMTAQKGETKLPTWSPTLSASRPRWAVTPTATEALVVMNPWITHWPPLEGTNTETTAADTSVNSGNVYSLENRREVVGEVRAY